MTNPAPLLQIQALSCIRQKKTLFTNLSLDLFTHTCLIVEGANGSGKSSLLRLLAGLTSPDAGEIFWKTDSIKKNRSIYQTHIHYIGHHNGLKMGLTIAENLQLQMQLYDMTPLNYVEILQELNLLALQHQPLHELSAGQQRRVALAKLWLFPKSIWILDEPFTTLDQTAQLYFMQTLGDFLQQGGLCVLSTHHPIPLMQGKAQYLRLPIC